MKVFFCTFARGIIHLKTFYKMKLRRLFLGVAVVALMAACGGKTETATETAVETPAVEETVTTEEPAAEEPAAAPAEKKSETKANTQTQKQEDPCEAKVKKFEKFVDTLKLSRNVFAKVIILKVLSIIYCYYFYLIFHFILRLFTLFNYDFTLF